MVSGGRFSSNPGTLRRGARREGMWQPGVCVVSCVSLQCVCMCVLLCARVSGGRGIASGSVGKKPDTHRLIKRQQVSQWDGASRLGVLTRASA